MTIRCLVIVKIGHNGRGKNLIATISIRWQYATLVGFFSSAISFSLSRGYIGNRLSTSQGRGVEVFVCSTFPRSHL
uniref:Putative ovule protein n=1 Tax=Solanum chacoense TaxID=4108 RepID=A0A0V0H1N8_SOLCH